MKQGKFLENIKGKLCADTHAGQHGGGRAPGDGLVRQEGASGVAAYGHAGAVEGQDDT